MIEIPEAVTLASQFDRAVRGKRIAAAVAGHTPHKWAWFHGDPGDYGALLRGRTIDRARSHGGFVEVGLDADVLLVFAEGVGLRLLQPGDARPPRHQLRLDFEDQTALFASVQMYGGLWAFRHGEMANAYLETARAAPSPLDNGFDRPHFEAIARAPGAEKLSVKALLATDQRVPGLGNGVLQDILYAARLHPKRKVATLSDADMAGLLAALKTTLAEMTRLGGRDTERDLFGQPGGYRTRMSRNTLSQPCPGCGTPIEKAQYLGGSVYFCPTCQPF